MARNELLSHSFMLMNFAAAAFLLTMQWQGKAEFAPGIPGAPGAAVIAPVEQDILQAAPRNATAAQTISVRQASLSDSTGARANLSPRAIPAFSSALVTVAPAEATRLEVDLSDRRVSFYKWGKVQASYPVGIGQPGWETPVGSFTVKHMEMNPAWQHPITGQTIPPGPDSPLGSRWIGFWTGQEYEIGFHATNQPQTVGQAVSHGCLRMKESDIQALYPQIKLGTLVVVHP